VRQVWGDNTESEIEIIRNIIESCTVIAVDTEFPGVVVRSIGHFSNSGEYHYQTLRMNVEMLKLVQLGFTFVTTVAEFRWLTVHRQFGNLTSKSLS